MKKLLSNHIITIISSLTLSSLIILYGIFESALLHFIAGLEFSSLTILRTFFALLWVGIIVLILYLNSLYKNNYFTRYGLYWDKKLNPFCSSCKSPLTFYEEYKGYKAPLFYCFKCNLELEATDEDGKSLNLKEARNKIEK